MMQLFEIVTENKPGVLARAAGIAGARGENIERIAALPAAGAAMSRIVIAVHMSAVHAEFVRRKLLKLVNVISVAVRPAGANVDAEFRAALDLEPVQVIDRSMWPPLELSRKARAIELHHLTAVDVG